jgi:hypothetical protein
VIDDKLFESDIVVTADGFINEWTREKEHEISIPDIENVLKNKPQTVIFGVGTIGKVVVSSEALDWLEQSKIDVISYKTEKAIETFRHIAGKEKVTAFFHIQD